MAPRQAHSCLTSGLILAAVVSHQPVISHSRCNAAIATAFNLP